MAIAVVGFDLSKEVFHVHAVDQRGAVVFRRARKRHDWVDAVRERVGPGAVIAMEACVSSHHWGRLLQSHGYEVHLIPGQFVKAFVKSNKNDRVDAEAIAEAAMRPRMRFVAVKSQRQQELQALHRVQDDVIQQRTAKANQIRGLTAEYGIIAPVGLNQLRKAIPEWPEDVDNGLSDLFRQTLADLHHDLVSLDERVSFPQ